MRQLDSARDEADYVIDDISRKLREREARLSDIAILYRTNAQSREFEEKLLHNNMPYNIVGGQNFYARKEIKDVLAYLKIVANGRDDVAVNRVINVPKRGIGNTSLSKAEDYAVKKGITLFDAMCRADEIPGIKRAAEAMKEFTGTIIDIRNKVNDGYYDAIPELIDDVINSTGYLAAVQIEDKEEDTDRETNIDELITKAAVFEEKFADENPEAEQGPTLSEFLNEVSLVADIDMVDSNADKLLLMTLHGAKGLEFKHVYIVGCEEGLFPGDGAISSLDKEELEEERRLAYVGITRAKEDLTLTFTKWRMLRGESRYNAVSRFVREIPEKLCEGNIPKEQVDFISDYESKSIYVKPVAKKGTVSVPGKPYSFAQLTKGKDLQNATIDYKVGDRVKHFKFGEGRVENIEDNDGTKMVTVIFDKSGQRVLNASFAKLVVVE